MNIQKVGALAGIASVCIIFGFILWTIYLNQLGISTPEITDPTSINAWMTIHRTNPNAINYMIFLTGLSGLMYLLVALALQDKMQSIVKGLTGFAVITAAISFAFCLAEATIMFNSYEIAAANDVSTYMASGLITRGLDSGASIAFGLQFISLGLAAIISRRLSRILGYIMLSLGVLTMVSVFLSQLMFVLIPLSIVSFFWIGITLFRK